MFEIVRWMLIGVGAAILFGMPFYKTDYDKIRERNGNC